MKPYSYTHRHTGHQHNLSLHKRPYPMLNPARYLHFVVAIDNVKVGFVTHYGRAVWKARLSSGALVFGSSLEGCLRNVLSYVSYEFALPEWSGSYQQMVGEFAGRWVCVSPS